MALTLVLFASSCNKEKDSLPTDSGTLTASFDFDRSSPGSVKAVTVVSSAKPVTSWANVESIQLLMVQGNIVKYAQSITPPVTGDATTAKQTFIGIPTGVYDVYLIANNGKSGSPLESDSYAGTDVPINVGTNISTALVKLQSAPAISGMNEPANSKLYKEPSEIFVAKHSAPVTITADTETDISSTPLELTRIVGLVRVLINNNHTASSSVDFTHANASFRMRRHANAWNIVAQAPVFETVKTEGTLLSDKSFNASEPTSGYSAGNILGGGFSKWQDFICLPGGSTTVGADKFDIVLSGQAPAGYTTIDGTILAGDGPVFWTGAVDGVVVANGILELQVTITTPGSGGPTVPPVTNYGNLSIAVSVLPWGNIVPIEVPL